MKKIVLLLTVFACFSFTSVEKSVSSESLTAEYQEAQELLDFYCFFTS